MDGMDGSRRSDRSSEGGMPVSVARIVDLRVHDNAGYLGSSLPINRLLLVNLIVMPIPS